MLAFKDGAPIAWLTPLAGRWPVFDFCLSHLFRRATSRRASPDFIVHEAAHIFHNCKRESAALPAIPSREWLLEIDFVKRETFAYACEAYSRTRTLGENARQRQGLLSELAAEPAPDDDRVEAAEYLDILRDAVAARNGWKRILGRCRPIRFDPAWRKRVEPARAP